MDGKLYIVARNTMVADRACAVLEELDVLDPNCRDLRDQEIEFISASSDPMLYGLTLKPENVILVDGWQDGSSAPYLHEQLVTCMAGSQFGGQSLADCATLKL